MAKQTAKRKQFTRELRLLRSTIKPRAEEVKRSICTLGYATSMLKTLFLIVFYYCFSIGITFYNQHFIQVSLHAAFFFLHYFKCVANYMKQLNFMWQLCCLVKCLHLCSNTRMLALESYFSFFPNDSLNYDFCFHVELYQICFVCLVICVSYLGIMKSMCCNACSKS